MNEKPALPAFQALIFHCSEEMMKGDDATAANGDS